MMDHPDDEDDSQKADLLPNSPLQSDEARVDVPSPIDLRDPRDARQWVATAERKRPWRAHLRQVIAQSLCSAAAGPAHILELGSGPGLLAEAILSACPVRHYTLFDFSMPMLEMSRERLAGHATVSFVHGDFKVDGWTQGLQDPFDVIVAMQSVHEIRHKRHLPGLYGQLRELLRPGGCLLVCDHSPRPDKDMSTALYATPSEQHAAFRAAGLEQVRTELEMEGMYICMGRRPVVVTEPTGQTPATS
jgi:SAM-dependent methyltransferase